MQNVAKWVLISALFAIPFIPLYVANSLFFPFITGKAFAFRILVEVAFVAWAVLALMNSKYRPRFSWVLVVYAAFVCWVFVADAFAVNAHKAFWSNFERMDGWVTMAHLFAFFLVTGAFLSADRLWRKWWLTFIAGSALICGYGLLQLSGAAEIHQSGVRLDTTMGNSAYLAAYLLFAIAVTLWHAFESRGWLRNLLFALTALQVLILFSTATRGAILAALGAAVIVTILWALESGSKGRKIALSCMVGILVLIGGFLLVRNSSFVQGNSTLSRLASISLESGAPRFAIWNMAGRGIVERPLLGWGQEGFNYVFNTYYEPSMYAQEPWFDRAHNVFLDWAIAGGVPALLLFLALLTTAGVTLYMRGAESSKAERVFLVGALAAYAFQSLFVFDNLFTYVPLAAVLAMAHAARSRVVPAIARVPEASENSAMTILAPVALVFGVVLMWAVNVPSIMAAGKLVYAISANADLNSTYGLLQETAALNSLGQQEVREQIALYAARVISSTAVSNEDKSRFASLAITELKKETDAHPTDARLLLQLASAYQNAGDSKAAKAQLDAARLLSPKKQQILVQEGVLAWQAGDTATAAAFFEQAYALDPSFSELASYAAAGQILTGNQAAADALLLQTFGTTTVDNNIIVYAYYSAKRYTDLIHVWELRAKDGSAETAYQLAAAYAVAGRIGEARATVLAAKSAHPETAPTAQALAAQFGFPL